MRGLVAIAGGTCSGKSTLASGLVERFSSHLGLLDEDRFYPDRSSLIKAELARINWDSIKSIDLKEMLRSISELVSTGRTRIPQYDNSAHARLRDTTLLVADAVVLVEGLHAITIVDGLVADGRSLPGVEILKIFLDCPESVRYQRRSKRERLSSTVPGDFENYWETSCQPTYLREILPQREAADMVLVYPQDTNEMVPIIEWISAYKDDTVNPE